MDRYDSSNDHYCFAGTTVLKNRLGITSMDALEIAEQEITSLTHRSVDYAAPPYTLDTLKRLHLALFGEIYEWAGSVRTVDISKGGTPFCTNARIEPEAAKLFANLERDGWLANLSRDAFCRKFAEYYCEINMIHPFREGNGRVQRILFEHLALSCGYGIRWDLLTEGEWLAANIAGVSCDYGPMAQIFDRILQP
ncbi:Fic/DOC family protein [Stenotrophomonas maltophilia]|uniref:Fic/DOC family protein n=1 Tax=Stenotrophomonas maltophilia TaxID=40324 RepID=UPI0039C1EFE1